MIGLQLQVGFTLAIVSLAIALGESLERQDLPHSVLCMLPDSEKYRLHLIEIMILHRIVHDIDSGPHAGRSLASNHISGVMQAFCECCCLGADRGAFNVRLLCGKVQPRLVLAHVAQSIQSPCRALHGQVAHHSADLACACRVVQDMMWKEQGHRQGEWHQ